MSAEAIPLHTMTRPVGHIGSVWLVAQSRERPSGQEEILSGNRQSADSQAASSQAR